MNLFFPDLNVWLALSVAGHSHNREAWNWWNALPGDAHLLFSRYTQNYVLITSEMQRFHPA
jgi:hypothetical protein